MPSANARLRRELCVFDFIEHVDCTIPISRLHSHTQSLEGGVSLPYGSVFLGFLCGVKS